MKRISFDRSLLFCLLLSFAPTVSNAAVQKSAPTAMAQFQQADLLDSEGHINTDILNPPQIERKIEQKIERQFQKQITIETPSPFSPKAKIANRTPTARGTISAGPLPARTLPPTVVKSEFANSGSSSKRSLPNNQNNFPRNPNPPKISGPTPRYQGYTQVDQKPAFDLPITYNSKVKFWVAFFQGPGHKDFRRYLERSSRYLPKIIAVLDQKGLPRDLAYVAMIESGFSSRAVSTASAVGYWQFIAATANRYNLKTTWWLDERRDITKSTVAAAQYLNDLYKMFDSWYLAAAGYNMGEGKVKRLIKRHQTKDYWILSQKKDFPTETVNYIPKLMAALLIAKAPAMYGFTNLNLQAPREYELFDAPGGTDLENLAYYMGIDAEEMRNLNPELTKGFVPQFVPSHRIRLPKGRLAKANEFIRASL